MKRLSKTKRFILGHPYCCFCGGVEPTTTIDHVPPKACFPEVYWPEEFEFPACEQCNGESRRDDQLFGFYSQLLDFNESNRTPADVKKITKLRDSIAHNFPDALPDPSTARLFIELAQSLRRAHSQSRCEPPRYFVSRLRLWKENSRMLCTTEKLAEL